MATWLSHLPDKGVLVVDRSPYAPFLCVPSPGLLEHPHNMAAGFRQEQEIQKGKRQELQFFYDLALDIIHCRFCNISYHTVQSFSVWKGNTHGVSPGKQGSSEAILEVAYHMRHFPTHSHPSVGGLLLGC